MRLQELSVRLDTLSRAPSGYIPHKHDVMVETFMRDVYTHVRQIRCGMSTTQSLRSAHFYLSEVLRVLRDLERGDMGRSVTYAPTLRLHIDTVASAVDAVKDLSLNPSPRVTNNEQQASTVAAHKPDPVP